jgi:DNA-binding protein Fis
VKISEIKRRALVNAMRVCKGNKTEAAAMLGINRKTVQRQWKAMKP